MNLKTKLEAILFVSLKPLSLSRLASICEAKSSEVEITLKELIDDYKERESGLSLLENHSSYQLTTASSCAELIKTYLKDETSGELSQPSLETLTIIAYRSPISKTELEKIRGVNCSLILKNLLLRALIEEKFDRKKSENSYILSHDFLRFLGISSVKELLDFDKLNNLELVNRFLSQDLQDLEANLNT